MVDAAPLDARSTSRERAPGAAVLQEVGRSRARSARQTEAGVTRRGDDGLTGRQESCVSENCPDDAFCQGLSLYGYNCTSCLIVSDGIGNCQEF